MAERIYATRTGEDALEPMAEARFSVEDDLQALIAKHPELLDGQQIRPGAPRRWVLVTREKGIAETADAGARWALDHLIVDQDAVPTLVEVKLGQNREVRRTLVGQMLEYAAHAAQSWTPDGLRETFERTCSEHGLDPDEELQGLLQDGDPDADGFWRQAVTNLDASRLRLLFVADDIPESLQRVVEFLNAQMPRIEVLAVEIKRFQGASMQTLVPRVIGKPNSSLTSGPSRRKLTRESFLAELPNDRARSVAVRLLDVAQQNGAVHRYGSSSVSVLMPCALARPTSAGWETTRGAAAPTRGGRGKSIPSLSLGSSCLGRRRGTGSETSRSVLSWATSRIARCWTSWPVGPISSPPTTSPSERAPKAGWSTGMLLRPTWTCWPTGLPGFSRS